MEVQLMKTPTLRRLPRAFEARNTAVRSVGLQYYGILTTKEQSSVSMIRDALVDLQ